MPKNTVVAKKKKTATTFKYLQTTNEQDHLYAPPQTPSTSPSPSPLPSASASKSTARS